MLIEGKYLCLNKSVRVGTLMLIGEMEAESDMKWSDVRRICDMFAIQRKHRLLTYVDCCVNHIATRLRSIWPPSVVGDTT